MTTRFKNIAAMILVLSACLACHKTNPIVSRTYRMGFTDLPPKLDFNIYIQSLNMWTQRADAAIISTEVPWDSLLNGVTPQNYITNNFSSLVNFYRSKNLKLWVYIDPENGLDRSSDASALVAINKSIAQTNMQQVYRNFVVAMDTMLLPEHLGLALETNLIRAAAPDSIYQGVRIAANNAASDVRAVDANVKISVSVQVDYAWGNLGGSGTYVGVAQDFIDFPFIQELGLSSYPYFTYADPSDIPIDYYSKLVIGKTLPVFVSEGGWTSHDLNANGTVIISDSLKQQRYITRQSQLLDNANAIGLFSLTFTDIDLSSIAAGTPPDIAYFAYLGLVDTALQPKPALSAWDAVFSRPLRAGN
jgi:hypothetical protein